jgi:hypothetical protein
MGGLGQATVRQVIRFVVVVHAVGRDLVNDDHLIDDVKEDIIARLPGRSWKHQYLQRR